jgi:hypothetical protein
VNFTDFVFGAWSFAPPAYFLDAPVQFAYNKTFLNESLAELVVFKGVAASRWNFWETF